MFSITATFKKKNNAREKMPFFAKSQTYMHKIKPTNTA